jgi:hypothetical protein
VLEAERDAASKEAQIAVQEKEGLRKQKELEATVIVEAEAQQRAGVIRAQTAQQVMTLDAEGAKRKL